MTVGDITGKKDPPKRSVLNRFLQLLGSILGGVCCAAIVIAIFPETPKWATAMFATIIFGFIETQFMIERIQKKLDSE